MFHPSSISLSPPRSVSFAFTLETRTQSLLLSISMPSQSGFWKLSQKHMDYLPKPQQLSPNLLSGAQQLLVSHNQRAAEVGFMRCAVALRAAQADAVAVGWSATVTPELRNKASRPRFTTLISTICFFGSSSLILLVIRQGCAVVSVYFQIVHSPLCLIAASGRDGAACGLSRLISYTHS